MVPFREKTHKDKPRALRRGDHGQLRVQDLTGRATHRERVRDPHPPTRIRTGQTQELFQIQRRRAHLRLTVQI